MLRRAAILAVTAILFAACSPVETGANASVPAATDTPTSSAATPTPEIVGDPALGEEIFYNGGAHENYKPQYYCAGCHSLDGSDGDGPSLKGIAARAGTRVPDLSAAEYLRQSILEPDAFVVGDYNHSMGSIHRLLLSETEVNALVAFLLTQ